MSNKQTMPALTTFRPAFRTFWAGQALSFFALHIDTLLISTTAITLLHANSTQVGILNAAQTIAFLFLGLPAGALVDRLKKKPLMVASSLLRATTMLWVAISWWRGTLTVEQLIAVSLLLGLATIFFDVAGQTSIPLFAGHSHIARANARLEATFHIARIIGLGLGGWLLGQFSATIAFLVPAILFIASASTLASIPYRETLSPTAGQSIQSDIAEGIHFVRSQPLLGPLFLCIAWASLTTQGLFVLTPVLGLTILGMSPTSLGILMSITTIGGICGATTYRHFIHKWGVGRTIYTCFILHIIAASGMLVAGIMHDGSWTVFTISNTIMAYFATIYNITQMSLRQVIAPPQLLGRVNATFRFIVWGVMPIGALISGWLADALGTLLALGIVCIAALSAGIAMSFTPTATLHTLPGLGTSKRPTTATN